MHFYAALRVHSLSKVHYCMALRYLQTFPYPYMKKIKFINQFSLHQLAMLRCASFRLQFLRLQQHFSNIDAGDEQKLLPKDTGYFVKNCTSVDVLLKFITLHSSSMPCDILTHALIRICSLATHDKKRTDHPDPWFNICLTVLQKRIQEFSSQELLALLNMAKLITIEEKESLIDIVTKELLFSIHNLSVENLAYGLWTLSQIKLSSLVVSETQAQFCSRINFLMSEDSTCLESIRPKLLVGLLFYISKFSHSSATLLLKTSEKNCGEFSLQDANGILKTFPQEKLGVGNKLCQKLLSILLMGHERHDRMLKDSHTKTLIGYAKYLPKDMQTRLSAVLVKELPRLSVNELLNIVTVLRKQKVSMPKVDKLLGHLYVMHIRNSDDLYMPMLFDMVSMYNTFDDNIQTSLVDIITKSLRLLTEKEMKILYTTMMRSNNDHPIIISTIVSQLQSQLSNYVHIEDIVHYYPLMVNILRLDKRERYQLLISVVKRCKTMSPAQAVSILIAIKQSRFEDHFLTEALCDVFCRFGINNLPINYLAVLFGNLHGLSIEKQEEVCEVLREQCNSLTFHRDIMALLINFKSSGITDDVILQALINGIVNSLEDFKLSELLGVVWALNDLKVFNDNLSRRFLRFAIKEMSTPHLTMEDYLIFLDIVWCILHCSYTAQKGWKLWTLKSVDFINKYLFECGFSCSSFKVPFLCNLCGKVELLNTRNRKEILNCIKHWLPHQHIEITFSVLVALMHSGDISSEFNKSGFFQDVTTLAVNRNILNMQVKQMISKFKSTIKEEDINLLSSSEFIFIHQVLERFPQYDPNKITEYCLQLQQYFINKSNDLF